MFTWDVKKALSNIEKHGISFEEAATIFSDPDGLHLEAIHKHNELRFFRIGVSEKGRILIVVFTVRKLSHEKETIRIISARQTSKKERATYYRLKD
jgi:uncharacterized protein